MGITLKPETLKTKLYGLYTCSSIINDLNEMRDNDRVTSQTHHKEEVPAGIKAYIQDRLVLCNKTEVNIDHFDPKQHPKGFLNVLTGIVNSHPSV